MSKTLEYQKPRPTTEVKHAYTHEDKRKIIVFDISTPKQVMFFKPMIEFLGNFGFKILVTTREYMECNTMLDHEGIPAIKLGKHGGASWYGKLRASAQRILELADFLNTTRPDCVITLSNPEICRASYGMGVPVICFNDIPEASIVARLTIPLTTVVFAPWLVAKDMPKFWANKVVSYQMLDPILWLRDYPVQDSDIVRCAYGLSPWKKLVVYRCTESQSSYVDDDLVGEAVEKLKLKYPGVQYYEIPRYEKHDWIDVVSLLANADLFIGGGGTMNIEAAWFGTPVLDVRKLPTKTSAWLEKQGLVKCVYETDEIVTEATKLLKHNTIHSITPILSEMTFPFDSLLSEVKAIVQNT